MPPPRAAQRSAASPLQPARPSLSAWHGARAQPSRPAQMGQQQQHHFMFGAGWRQRMLSTALHTSPPPPGQPPLLPAPCPRPRPHHSPPSAVGRQNPRPHPEEAPTQKAQQPPPHLGECSFDGVKVHLLVHGNPPALQCDPPKTVDNAHEDVHLRVSPPERKQLHARNKHRTVDMDQVAHVGAQRQHPL